MQEHSAAIPARTYTALGGIVLAALVVASPAGPAFGSTWLPAVEFAIGVGSVTLSFIEAARALSAWLARSAPLGWIGGAFVVALGMFTVGSTMMLHARTERFDWVAIGGILVALAGVRWQHRSALR